MPCLLDVSEPLSMATPVHVQWVHEWPGHGDRVEMRCGHNSINSLSLRLNIHPASSADWHTEVTILKENSESIGDKLITSDPIPLLELTPI